MIKQMAKRGFTLVELMIVVAIVGVLATLAIVGYNKFMASAKTTEARNILGDMNKAAVAAYERESAPSELIAAGGQSANAMHQLCASAPQVPAQVANIANAKYQPNPAEGQDYNVPAWKCLKFTQTKAQYFQYAYTRGNAPQIAADLATLPTATGWIVEAVGNLNGDTVFSNFGISGDIVDTKPIFATQIEEVRADE